MTFRTERGTATLLKVLVPVCWLKVMVWSEDWAKTARDPPGPMAKLTGAGGAELFR
jgi:hypothetical protein